MSQDTMPGNTRYELFISFLLMSLLRKHWFDIGGLLAIVSLIYIYISYPHQSSRHTILWLSMVSLFIHQLEEFRYPDYFPGMVNSAMYKSKSPERYPLNT